MKKQEEWRFVKETGVQPSYIRQRYSDEQKEYLEDYFRNNSKPKAEEYLKMSTKLAVPEHNLRIWFQNKRAEIKHEGLPKRKKQPRLEVSHDPETRALRKSTFVPSAPATQSVVTSSTATALSDAAAPAQPSMLPPPPPLRWPGHQASHDSANRASRKSTFAPSAPATQSVVTSSTATVLSDAAAPAQPPMPPPPPPLRWPGHQASHDSASRASQESQVVPSAPATQTLVTSSTATALALSDAAAPSFLLPPFTPAMTPAIPSSWLPFFPQPRNCSTGVPLGQQKTLLNGAG